MEIITGWAVLPDEVLLYIFGNSTQKFINPSLNAKFVAFFDAKDLGVVSCVCTTYLAPSPTIAKPF